MKTLILCIMLSSTAFAETYKIAGELVSLENMDGLLVRGCEKKCLALKVVGEFKNIDLKKARAKETFYGSVGSDVCRLVYKAESVIGVNEDRDQRAFCVFKDASLIEINSLGQYLKDKKIVR